MNDYLQGLIQKALDYHAIARVEDLPWYSKVNGTFTDETAITLWLEDRLGVEKPTLTLNADCLAELFTDTTFRLLLTREAVRTILDKHLDIVDERIKDRISGEYTPELNKRFYERLNVIIECEVGNFLRLRCTDITAAVHKAVDKHMETTIANEVNRRFNSLKKKLMEITESSS